jgi:uncharacterized sulfatase
MSFPLTRRSFINTSAVSAASSLLVRGRQAERPNILWITCEDISPDLGCYGDSWARTPNLDKLASQGARYSNAFSVYGVCAPSRSSIISAMYPTAIGTCHMRSQGVPPSYVKCFTERLRAAGYYCTNNVKTDYNFPAPLTAWDESSRKAHWRGRAKGQPFFSVLNITTTHESRIWPQSYTKWSDQVKPEHRHDPAEAKVPPYYPDTPLTRRDWANYYDLISVMDQQAAHFLEQLEDDGLADNTIVFYYSDHGRGLPRAKRWIYDSGIHVPLMIRWPGRIAPGTVTDRLVSLMDLGPTLLSVAGVDIPSHMQGLAFLGDHANQAREYIFAARDRMDETYDIIRAARDKHYKYIRNFQACKPYAQRRLNAQRKLVGPQKLFFLPEKPEEELYDITADPHEVQNLAGLSEQQDTLQRMRGALEEWMKQTNDLGLIPEEELKERMRPGGVWAATEKPAINPNGGTFSGPVTVRITCPTDGSSIAYTTEAGENAHWSLYSKELQLDSGVNLRVKACRLGYKDSPEIQAEFRIG